MDLNFSKKTRKIVASLLAVAILLGVLPVSGLTGNSSGAEGNNGSANTIFVKSDHQPVLFDSNGNVKSVLTKKDGTYTGTNVNSSDQIVFLRNDVAKEITVGNTIVFYKKSSNTSTTDDAEPYDRIHVWKENGEPYKEWKSDDAIMKKYSGNLYYYIYPSDKNKVIFHNGLNDDEVGVKKSKEWDLNEWQVYTKNGLAGSLLNTLPTCKVGDNNVFSYYSGKITSEKIEKSDKFGATVTDVAGNESDVFKNDKITFYKFLTSKENSEALIDNVKVNDVDGFKGVVTAQKLKEDCTEVEYTYTYTDNTYGIKFTDTKTVNYTFETPLSVSGKWNVKVNDKEVTVNDKLYYKDETPFNKITVSFDNAKVTYGGKEISGATNDSATEDGSLKSEYFLNDKEVSSDNLNIQTDSNKSEDENILKVKYSYTVNGKTYETFETFTFYCYVDSTAPEITSFEFATVESDVDKVLSFLTFGIYNNDQVVVTVNAEDKNISSGIKKISLYNGDTLLNTQEFGEYISNGSATFTLNKSDELYKLYAVAEDKADNCGKKWTFNLKDHNENCYKPIEYNPDKGNTLPELVSYGGIDKFSDLTVTPENFKHQVGGLFSYKEKGELFNITLSESLSALSETTVTVNKDGSEKEFSDTITFDTTSKYAKKEDCKLDYDLKLAEVFDAIGVSGSDITGNYTITVVATNNAGVSKVFTYDFSIDNTAPKPEKFTISGESATDKILKFLTFGIYSKNSINVKVNANDYNPSSGVKTYTLYELKNDEYRQIGDPTTDGNFTLSNRDEAYKLFVRVTDNFDNTSNYYTFAYTGYEKDSYNAIKSADATEVVRYDGKDKFSDKLTVTPEKFEHHHEKGNLFSYKNNGEFFKIELSESLSALSEATVTVNKDGSEKEFSDTVTFNTTSKDAKKEDCKLDYDLNLSKVFEQIGVKDEAISGKYIITVVATNNAGVSSEPYKYDFSIDNTAPMVTKFRFEDGSSAGDKLLSFLTFGIYHNDAIKVTVSAKDVEINNATSGMDNYEENHAKIELYNGDTAIDGSYSYSYEDGVLSRTFMLSDSENAYQLFAKAGDNFDNVSVGYTFAYTGYEKDSYDAIKSADATEVVSYNGNDQFSDLAVTPENFKHHDENGNLFSYKENEKNDELFNIKLSESLSALSEATVTVNKDGSEKEFSDTITFVTTSKDAKKEDCKLDYDLNLSEVFEQIGVKNEAISGNYTITVVATNNAGVSSKEYTYDFSIDNTAPEPKTFTISGESATDKILKFLTFGIYSKNTINVKVAANDADPSSGIVSYTLYDKKDGEYSELANITKSENSEDSKFAEFTIDNRNKEYNLFVTVTDKFDNTSNYYTFDYTGYEKDSYDAIKSSKAPEVVRYDGKDKFSDKLTVTPENFKHQSDKLFSYKENGEAFKLELSESLSALSEATVTVNKDGSAKSFSETITFDTTSKDARKDNCKLDYDLKLSEVFKAIGVSGSDISGNYTITVVAINNAGVSSKAYTYDFSIDNTAPVITLFAIENGSQNPIVDETSSQEYRYYFQHNTNVTVTAKDSASGVKEIHFRAYDVVKKDNAVDETKTVSSNNNAVFEVPANFKGEIYAYAVDKFDNSSIDKNIQGEGEKKPDDLIVETQQHHNGNASVTMSRAKASYKDNSGLDLYSGNVNARVVFEDAYAGIKDATITVYDYKNDVTGTIYAEIGNDGSIKKTEVTGSVNNIIFNDDYTTSKDNLLPKLVIDYVVTDNSNNIKITTSMTDRAGNKTDNVKDSLSIDKTKPVIDVKYDNNEHTTYGGNDYYKADRTATVTVTERNFDESLVEAAIMRNGGRYTTIGGWTHNNNTADPDKSTHVAKIVYNTDGDFTFDIAVKDKAMNSADKFTQQKFTVDKTAPVIDVSFDNNSAKNGNYYKADRTATIKITEHNFNSGSQYVNIPVTAEGTTAPSVVGWSGSGDDHNATVSFNKDGKYSFTVDYTDLAGNKAVQKKVDSFYIDKTAPEVEITGVADHQAYNGTVAPVVTYRDDNFTDDHDFKFTRIDINSKSDDTSKFDYDTDGNGVTEFIYKYRDFAEVLENDGIYNFTVELSDKAGNSTSKSVTFSVNRFGSTFKASDESEKLIKNGYTNAEQDIVVEEINVSPLTKHSVTLAKSGGNSTELVENTDYKFTSSNNGNEWCKSVYTVNKKNFSDEAAYTVTIMSVDKAKNTNNNRMANSSLSTEQKNKRECAISFVVDKTSPLVSITGIKDNELYKEASKKVKIVCEDDNLDKSKLVVTLDNKKLAEGEDYTIVDDKDGSIAGMLTAEIVLKAETGGIKENLKVTIGDLAGNTGEKSVDNFILSANIFQRFFANPVLVICTFAGLALVIAAVIFFVVKKRKKAE